jgi:hypothetical protein
MDWLKKYLLASAAYHAPRLPGEDGGDQHEGEDQDGSDENIEGQESDEGLEAGEQDASLQEGEDETEGEEGDDEEQVDAAPARRPNRAQSRIQSLTQSAREQRERADRIERELQELRAAERARTQQPQQESQEARAARRALMDPMEVMREDLRESEQRTARLLQQQMIQTREATDSAAYQALLRDKPALKKYDAEVEKVRKEQEAAGNFVPRQVLLELAVGRAALAAASKPLKKPAGQRQVEQQRVRPVRAGGDTATQRGRQGDSLEKRLDGVQI